MIVFLNDDWVEGGARLDVADRGFLLGDGAFETAYAEGGRGAFLGAHQKRLCAGLETLRIAPPARLVELPHILGELAKRNAIAGPAAARITVSRGAGVRGLAISEADATPPTLLVTLAPYEPPRAAAALVVTTRRRPAFGSANGFKAVGGYVENVLALDDARRVGADDGVLVNEHGRLVCASAANLFIIDGAEHARTPSLKEGAMPGVVRDLLLCGAREAGVEIAEAPLAAEDIASAGGFLTNSLIGVRPAFFPGGAPPEGGPFARLQTWYRERLRAAIAAAPGGEEDPAP